MLNIPWTSGDYDFDRSHKHLAAAQCVGINLIMTDWILKHCALHCVGYSYTRMAKLSSAYNEMSLSAQRLPEVQQLMVTD